MNQVVVLRDFDNVIEYFHKKLQLLQFDVTSEKSIRFWQDVYVRWSGCLAESTVKVAQRVRSSGAVTVKCCLFGGRQNVTQLYVRLLRHS
mgnify:FL=1